MNGTKIFDLMKDGSLGLLSAFRKMDRQNMFIEGMKQYNPELHTVASKSKRPDKVILVPSPTEKDEKTGQPKMVRDTAKVSRAPLAIEKYIIEQKAAFARGNGVMLKPSVEDSELFYLVKRNWEKNKTDFYLGEIARREMSETQVAVIYQSEPAEKIEDFRLRFKIVSPAKGDKITPYFEPDSGNMIAFTREYEVGDNTLFDVYVMNEKGLCDIYRFINDTIGETLAEDKWIENINESTASNIIKTPYPDLPVIYWEQDTPECYDTKELMVELEWAFNDFLTQMGYSADPILFGRGDSMEMPAKGSPGKFITSRGDADLKYVTPDNATEARELQFRMLQKFIFSLNRAVLLDLETMKELGDVSGSALDRYLLDAYMAATDRQQGSWGVGVQRMVNFKLKVYQTLRPEPELTIDVIFSKYSIEDIKEKIEIAMKANGGLPVIDHEESITMAGISDDSAETLRKINEQSVKQSANEV